MAAISSFVYSGILSGPGYISLPFVVEEKVTILFADISGTTNAEINLQDLHP